MSDDTRYVVLIERHRVPAFEEPFGPGYQVVFDEEIETAGFAEIRVWVHVSVENYEADPVTRDSLLTVRFLHRFPGGSFDYEEGTIPWNRATSFINGYVSKPIIGDTLRLLCRATDMPPGPYRIHVTYYLV